MLAKHRRARPPNDRDDPAPMERRTAFAKTCLTTIRKDPIGPLHDPELGTAWIRDQSKMSEAGLTKALNGSMTVAQWCELLNNLTFFFPSKKHTEGLIARYSPRPQVLLALSTASLLAEFGVLVKLARINTGNTSHKPAPRGHETFQSVTSYRGTPSTVKEVAIKGDVIDLRQHLNAAWYIASTDEPTERPSVASTSNKPLEMRLVGTIRQPQNSLAGVSSYTLSLSALP
jgi:hypothetical protein